MKKILLLFCIFYTFTYTIVAQELFDAIRNNNIAKVKEIISSDPKLVNTPGNNHFTPLLFATNSNKPEIAEFLISKGANVDDVFFPDYYGSTPISFAIRNNNLDLVKLLHEKGANIQFRTKLEENYLHFAAAQNRVEIAEYLINNGIDVNSVKNGGLTSLHISTIMGNVDIVKLLIEKEAKLDIKCYDNGTPLHFAIATRNREIEDFLRKNGASDFPRNFPEYCGSYLGQQPPGEEPVMFAPELFRDIYRSYGTPTFSPDGKELFFYGYFMPGIGYSRIWWMREEDGKWTAPELAPFSNYTSWGPAFSDDGNRLYFASRTPVEGNPATSNDLWFVEKVNGKWSEPQNPGTPPNRSNYNEMDPQLSADGSIYFKAFGPGSNGTGMYKSQFKDNKYSHPVNLDNMIDSSILDDSNMEYVISYNYGGPRYAEISICFHKPDGTWTKPVYMGDNVHQGQGTSKGEISHDGKYFFFVQNITPYWVDASFIEDLRKEALKND